MTERNLMTNGWEGYELLDSGDGMKLEKFGEVVVARPDTQAIWKKMKPELWKGIHATFKFEGTKGAWDIHKDVPAEWPISWKGLTFLARLSGFKHTGIFPEQEPNWDWISDCVEKFWVYETQNFSPPKILNLFGYTGIASLAAAKAGAFVTHVDASKQSLTYANANAELSGIPKDRIKWVAEDALGFARREVRRGARYDGIILDPPVFGRGGKGEVWNLDEDLPKLLEVLKELLSDKPGSFLLLNGYAAGYAPLAFAQAVEGIFGNVSGESGELRIKEADSTRSIPAGIYVRFVRE